MAKSIGKILLSNALPKRKARINLGGTNITSMDFGKYKVLHSSLLMPGDKINGNIAHNIRLSGMVAPTIGSCNLKVKSFFVPCRVAWDGFQSFITNTPWYTGSGALTPTLPKVNNMNFVQLFSLFTGVRVNTEVVSGRSIYSPQFDTPKFGVLLGHDRTIDIINPRFASQPLTEVIGVCNGVGEDGSLLDYKPIDRVLQCANGEYYPRFKQRISAYHGKDFDFVGQICGFRGDVTSQSHVDSRYIDFMNYPWQHTPTDEECSDPTAHLSSARLTGNYCVFRFTPTGKAVYDLLINLGYSVNFAHPYMNIVATDYRESGNIYFHPDLHFCSAWQDSPVGTSAPTSGMTRFTAAQCCTAQTYHLTTGYTKSFFGYRYDTHTANVACDTTAFNMLPIFSYWRLYLDHLCPMQFFKTWSSYYDQYMHLNGFNASVIQLAKMYDSIVCTYDKDYFTTAWQSPNSPSQDGSTNINYDVNNNMLEYDSSNHAPYSTNDNQEQLATSTGMNISALGLRLLNALTKYKRLNNVSGQRAVDRMLAHFGVRPSDERVNRAELIGGFNSEFDISLVMSQAQTDGANLGDYVAHGESRGGGNLGSYTTSEWGYFLVVAYITPKAKYYQGRCRQNMYTDVSCFLTPELDELDAMQAIRHDELYADNRIFNGLMIANTSNVYAPSKTFGYTRMWGEMKVGRDVLSGDFRLDSRGKYSNESFHLFRTLPDVYQRTLKNNPLVNDNGFNICNDAFQYDRIFQYDGDDYDHFFGYFKIDVDCSRNTKSITDFTMNDENDDTRLTSSEMFGHQI